MNTLHEGPAAGRSLPQFGELFWLIVEPMRNQPPRCLVKSARVVGGVVGDKERPWVSLKDGTTPGSLYFYVDSLFRTEAEALAAAAKRDVEIAVERAYEAVGAA